ncbi:MAG: argininosuccinate lyase [Ktedonobacterales bacterium]
MKLWYKGYDLAPLVERFEGARNVRLDIELARSDIWGSLGHVAQLCAVGLLTEPEADALHWTLSQLLLQAEAGTLIPATAEEDIHTLVEDTLITLLGDTGKKVHTGRSRNDQILTDVRLYAKESMLRIAEALLDAADALLRLAKRYEWTPLPGYTHMQRGMLSSVGLWASAFVEVLLDDCLPLLAAYTLSDQSPLGSGAAYGSSLPLDREYSARMLGFMKPQHNVLAAANSRGKTEAAVVGALALIMLDLSKFAQDVLLYTTSEYGFFQVPEELCSGSSMMPQKRNLGALELVRARAQTVIAAQSQMLALLGGLPSGYNMDYQETKAPFIESLHITEESLAIAELFAGHITVDRERVRAACSDDLFATDRANALVRTGVPFRDAYLRAATAEPEPEHLDLEARLRERTGTGMPGNLELEALATLIAQERAGWEARQTAFAQAIAALVQSRPHPGVAAAASGRASPPGTSAAPSLSEFAGDIVLGI